MDKIQRQERNYQRSVSVFLAFYIIVVIGIVIYIGLNI